MKTLPKMLYVRLEEPGKNWYLVADTEIDGEDGDTIGRYELVEIGVVRTHSPTMEKTTKRGGRIPGCGGKE